MARFFITGVFLLRQIKIVAGRSVWITARNTIWWVCNWCNDVYYALRRPTDVEIAENSGNLDIAKRYCKTAVGR